MKKTVIASLTFLLSVFSFAAPRIEPSATYLFAEKDGGSLYFDLYEPTQGSATTLDGVAKPTVIYIFGGGFSKGARDLDGQKEWYAQLCDEGYKVIAIDYRLGLKGVDDSNVNKEYLAALLHSIDIAVEDLFSATCFIISNKEELGVDPSGIVLCGSSAGAITALQAEWEICNSTQTASVLPEGFNYAGVISFSGAIFNLAGGPVYKKEPCPTLLLHGTADGTVPYDKKKLGKMYFGGSNSLAEAYGKAGFNYGILRFQGNRHEIAASFTRNFPEVRRFLETNVIRKEKRVFDACVTDSGIQVWSGSGMDKLQD